MEQKSHACNFIKKETLAQVFPCEFCKISQKTFSYRSLPMAASEIKTSQTGQQTITTNILSNISRNIGNQGMKFGQLI